MKKKISSILFLLSTVLLLIIMFSQKSVLEQYLSKEMKSMISSETRSEISESVDSLYNYEKNNKNYLYTFLEFGATGCIACKKMEIVMNEVENDHPEINVVFFNVSKPDNHEIMKYYGISTIPTQVLLKKNGKEYFRHTGYITTKDLLKHFK